MDFFLELRFGDTSQTFSFLQQKLIGDMKDKHFCLFFMYYCILFSYGKNGCHIASPSSCHIHLANDGSEVKVANDEILDIFNFLVALALASGAFAVGSRKLCLKRSFLENEIWRAVRLMLKIEGLCQNVGIKPIIPNSTFLK